MTNVIFSFDTEDIINERGADGILRCARILREEGVKGCFNIIGLLPEALRSWGRDDIVKELQWHEIDFHSHSHSIHPTINEYTDKENYYEALDVFLNDESAGIKKVKDFFKRDYLPAACIPGNSTSYVAHYGYEKLGFKFFSGDTIYDKINYRPVYNCNTVSLHYARSLDGVLFKLKPDEIADYVNETAREKHTMIFYHHPQRAFCKSFWDADNYNKKNTPKEAWIKSEIHDPKDTERFYENFRALVKFLRDDGDFCIMTYAELAEKLNEDKRVIDLDVLSKIRKQLNEKFFPVTAPSSYCIADVFHACRTLLLGKNEHICDKVYGFLSEPYVTDKEVTVTREEAISIAKSINENDFLPPIFYASDKAIGPRDLLDVFFAFLLDGVTAYTVKPSKPWQIDLGEFPSLRDLNYKGSWIHSDTLNDDYLSSRLRYQSWTVRLPKGTKRTVF
jgi:hypothetical protein